jgi:hypothetical protein
MRSNCNVRASSTRRPASIALFWLTLLASLHWDMVWPGITQKLIPCSRRLSSWNQAQSVSSSITREPYWQKAIWIMQKSWQRVLSGITQTIV